MRETGIYLPMTICNATVANDTIGDATATNSSSTSQPIITEYNDIHIISMLHFCYKQQNTTKNILIALIQQLLAILQNKLSKIITTLAGLVCLKLH